ncbi:hypothetical protein GB937_003901 [Aspergillus fischeri]|nr:hypothetical protein GB937_003901 [Aspergillus fischeri]
MISLIRPGPSSSEGSKSVFVAGYGATQQSSYRRLEPFGPTKYVIINGVALNKVQLIHPYLRGY